MLGFYYFTGDCENATNKTDIPQGMLTAGNTIFLSFVIASFNPLDKYNQSDNNLRNLYKIATQIKTQYPNLCVMFSIGGQTGSKSQQLYNYLKHTHADTIAADVLNWPCDGIDWDLETQSGGLAEKYGQDGMPEKLAKISQNVSKGGMNVTMAGFGSWIWDQSMGPLYNALITSNSISKYGVMLYPPSQGDPKNAIKFIKNNWLVGCKSNQCKKPTPVDITKIAGGISGKATVDQAQKIATQYFENNINSVIVWMVKPNAINCPNQSGWVVNNDDIASWSRVLNILNKKKNLL
jgi:hypothetical protein